ncbi:hypothetical protein Ddye_028428 [Dipteronia dyeriana]|uniref:Uncharacterized protein n=1 Tax=Dipteronia dyeriana TaxID=168575 RepID=A0AAD9TRH1_9ROSI|nr:hypothetical protein Ddye_028428 [Dipteronia dyeriana]
MKTFWTNFFFNSANDGSGFLGSVKMFAGISNHGVKLCGVGKGIEEVEMRILVKSCSAMRKLVVEAFPVPDTGDDQAVTILEAFRIFSEVAYHMFQGTSARLLQSKNIDKSMDWFYTKRRGPEWKQGWSGQTLASVSVVVLLLLWLSLYTGYKAQ